MEISHILKLKTGKFNVPVHVLNPYRKYKGEVCITLRDYVFPLSSKVALLVDMKKCSKEFDSLSIQDASLIATTFEKKDYQTMILERPDYDFCGEVSWDEAKGEGHLTVDSGGGPVFYFFSFVESLQEVKWRSIARLSQDIQGYLDVPAIKVDYIWSSKFSGVNQLKLVVYDYKIL